MSRKDVILSYNKLKNVKSVTTELGIDATTVRNILRNSGIKIDSSSEVMKREKGKQVISTNFYTGERIVHETISDAFEYVKTIYPNQEAILNNPGGYRKKIIECCRGNRRFFPSKGEYKLSWQAVNPDAFPRKNNINETQIKSVTILNPKTKRQESFKSVRLCAKKIHEEYPNESFDKIYSALRRLINAKQVNTPYGYRIVY